MAKVLVNESSLTGIADAIRSKNGSTDTYKPSQMAAAITAISGAAEPIIEALSVTSNGTYTASNGVDGYSPITVNVPQDGSPPESAFVISGDCVYRFSYNGWNWFIENYGNRITTNNITDASYMFYNYSLLNIPFELNFTLNKEIYIDSLFCNCYKLKTIPKINNCKPYSLKSLFNSCNRLRYLPDDIENWFDWSKIDVSTYQYAYSMSNIFNSCYSLRKIPLGMIRHVNRATTYNNSIYYHGFYNCYSLDEIINMPSYYNLNNWLNNSFNSTFDSCYRLKNITFAKQEDGTPYVVNWKSQVIDFTNNTGYAKSKISIINYNSGITADKEVTDATTYAALKNDPDWFTCDIAYSRYNHDSAVATINSLPDTSAYLATAGGTNTIKFKGAAGSATDGGAINTLTEEEIAVATAKGWTCSFV